MKKFVSLLLTGALACALLAGCGGGNTASPSPSASAPASSAPVEPSAPAASNPLEGTVLKVGATPAPHAEILEVAKEILAAKDITLDIQVYNDYVVPNTVVDDGTVDANYFQHLPYLEDFNAQNGTHIASVAAIHVEPMGLYGGKQTTLDALSTSAQ